MAPFLWNYFLVLGMDGGEWATTSPPPLLRLLLYVDVTVGQNLSMGEP